MESSSKVLLDLETKNSSVSSIESSLLFCKSNELSKSQTTEPKPPHRKPITSSVPKSQVLGKLKDFLGVLSEANKRLELDSKDNSMDHDIEVLTGNESEYIEMDLMLGVADLHTPEAVAAAESALAGYQPVISLAASGSESESEDDSRNDDDDEDDDNGDADVNIGCSPENPKRSRPAQDESSSREVLRNGRSKKQPKIIELS